MTGDLGDGVKDKDVDSFRNKKLFDFGFNDPTKVEINGAAYQKSGDKWTGPAGQIDPGSIQSVIDKLRDLSASKFADRQDGRHSGSRTRRHLRRQEQSRESTINKNGDEYDAQRDGEPAVYVLDAGAFDDLQKADLRNQALPGPETGQEEIT